jgi:hypothetical protein
LISEGILPMQILVEGRAVTSAAVKGNLDQWIGRVPLPYTSTLDSVAPQPTMETFFSVPRDQFLIVDLKTMKLVDIFDTDPMGAIAEVEGLVGAAPPDAGTPDM